MMLAGGGSDRRIGMRQWTKRRDTCISIVLFVFGESECACCSAYWCSAVHYHALCSCASVRKKKKGVDEGGGFLLLLRLRPPSNDHSKGKGGEGGGDDAISFSLGFFYLPTIIVRRTPPNKNFEKNDIVYPWLWACTIIKPALECRLQFFNVHVHKNSGAFFFSDADMCVCGAVTITRTHIFLHTPILPLFYSWKEPAGSPGGGQGKGRVCDTVLPALPHHAHTL